MASNDLHLFLKRETDVLAAEYSRIRARTREDPGTAGDQGEENWKKLFEQWLPEIYPVVTKGRILGFDGIAGPQIDVLVLSPSYPPALRDKKLYLAGGVVAAFECKTTLLADHVREFFENCVHIRKLTPFRPGTPQTELRPKIVYGLLTHSHDWKAPGSKPAENITRLISENDQALVAHPRDAPDLVCVADVGAWSTLRTIITARDGLHRGIQVMSTYLGAYAREGQVETFTPIGSLLAFLFLKLGRQEPYLRNLQEHFAKAGVHGNAVGANRGWRTDILSDELRLQIDRIHGSSWIYDDWYNCVF